MSAVIQIVQHLKPGGIETMALDLAAFSSADHAWIVSLEGTKEDAIAAWPRLQPLADRLIFLNKKPGLHLRTVWRLRQCFKHHHATVVHTHHIGPLLYAGLAARLAGVKHLIHTEHDAWHLEDKQRRTLQQRLIWLTRPTLVADAETVAAAMRHHLNLKDVTVIRNGINSDRFQPGNKAICRTELGIPVDSPLIGCSGRMESVKGQNILIDAMPRLPDNVHLALAGSGSLEKALRQQVETLALGDRVHFLGHLDNMPQFYQSLDVFCLPSFKEGFPLSSLEAQSCGVPAVVTDVGGSKETLCPNSGLAVPAGDAIAMADALNRQLSRQRGSSTPPDPRRYITEHGDVRTMVGRYERLSGISGQSRAAPIRRSSQAGESEGAQ